MEFEGNAYVHKELKKKTTGLCQNTEQVQNTSVYPARHVTPQKLIFFKTSCNSSYCNFKFENRWVFLILIKLFLLL